MKIMHNIRDSVTVYDPAVGAEPDYDQANPIEYLCDLWAAQRQHLAADQVYYVGDTIQVLLPYTALELHGPSGGQWDIADPLQQVNKEDFQKQNIKSITMADTAMVRGWVSVAGGRVPFIRFVYRGGPFSTLAGQLGSVPGSHIGLWAQVGQNATPSVLSVPYDANSDCYAIEIWGFQGNLEPHLDPAGKTALAAGALIADAQLLPSGTDFQDPPVMADLTAYHPNHPMHPLNNLHCQVAWCDASQTVWDSRDGLNHQYRFQMLQRGWSRSMSRGVSKNPHGGTGYLEFRNLFSEYRNFKREHRQVPSDQPVELGRVLEPWNIDAFGNMAGSKKTEDFLVVRFVDLCSVNAQSAVGLHRHRDNQEVFFIIEGEALCFLGDWAEHDDRERAVEVRHLQRGDMFPLKNGQLHALVNLLDTPCSILVFGSYD
jgi:mannose-6-phosphate isomerase-like protein (cupin superfamily)